MPRMLAGHYQGRWISMMSHMIKPTRVLEIGTYTGYSALCWAERLSEAGKSLYATCKNEELEEMVKHYIREANMENQIIYLVGNALTIIPSLQEDWDIVFIDADKENYSNYYDLVFDGLKSGYIIADNVLWSGKVLNKSERSKDKDTMALHQFNLKVSSDPRVESNT